MPTAEPTAEPSDESPDERLGVSVVIPVYNEDESLPHLHEALVSALEALTISWEVLFIDDGSSDRSANVLRALAEADPRFRMIRFRRNFGQTAAMAAGFAHARGDVVVPMDADLQNDPRDIQKLLDTLNGEGEGGDGQRYDVVSGWRADRKDNFLTVTLPSRMGNAVIGRATGVRLHDYGCTLTAYRREVLQEIRLYGEMHRFIPAWAASVGARITEIPVRHHARRWGKSKYNLSKAVRVILDLITVRFLIGYRTKPLYFFGGLGLKVWALAGASWTWTIAKKIIWGEPLYTDPFFMIGIFLGLAGLQILLFGLLAELSMRTYYESQQKTIYIIAETVNLPPQPPAPIPPIRGGIG